MCDVHTWKCQRVGKWLKRAGFPQYVQSFTQEHRIDGMALLSLTEMDLRSPPLELKVLGDIKRLMLAIRKLQRENQYHLAINQRLENGTRTLRQRDFFRGDGSDFAESDGFTHSDDSSSENKVYIPTFKPEIWKTVISFLYVFLVFLVTAFVMVIVHDRVPDREKYPPLPDLFLDSVPRIPWAFVMCEITGLVLCTIWCIVLLLHKHRFILMRRMFALTGTVFMLRCLTMLMTSLSVPGDHLECSGKLYGDFWTRLHRAFVIWSGLGMTLTGVHTCGDYMFSGHTVVLTLLNHFITEYTPRNMYTLHISSWVMNLFGIFFILAAHEHYSIDVFIAFYISSRLFLYYHTLANNRVLRHGDKDRTRAWFPLFSFFESEVDGIVPNEYEWPFPIPSIFRENEENENDT